MATSTLIQHEMLEVKAVYLPSAAGDWKHGLSDKHDGAAPRKLCNSCFYASFHCWTGQVYGKLQYGTINMATNTVVQYKMFLVEAFYLLAAEDQMHEVWVACMMELQCNNYGGYAIIHVSIHFVIALLITCGEWLQRLQLKTVNTVICRLPLFLFNSCFYASFS